MQSKLFIGAALVISVLAASTLEAVPTRRAAAVRFLKPTAIAGAFVLGTVVIEHDDEKMARGEPCTTVYRYKSDAEYGDPIVSFMCTPEHRPLAEKFEATLVKTVSWPDRLLEFQLPGEREGHGVPSER